jgi:hypothetical protein
MEYQRAGNERLAREVHLPPIIAQKLRLWKAESC